ncbi:Ncapd2p [Cichlidogyrus casuarinus]|uniref:Ncapd2p n=1 Tax=Cichlidogyrus casuarinus TaxID=1844966 RepID=A0ABD2QGQ3_9PLAT
MKRLVAKILTVLATRYGNAMNINIELNNLLKSHAHMVPILITMIDYFLEDSTMSANVRDLIKEICSLQVGDKDTSVANVSSFIQELAKHRLDLANAYLPVLRNFLDSDSYQLRICALVVIGEVLKEFNGKEQLEDCDKIQRDRLMDQLFEHIWDVNSFVRGKVLQIWNGIVLGEGLPVSRQCQLAARLVGPDGALHDVSTVARKFAIKTLSSMVLQNPASQLSHEQLLSVLKVEEQRLETYSKLLEHGHVLQQAELENRALNSTEQDEENEKNEDESGLSEEEEEQSNQRRSRRLRRAKDYDKEARGLIEATKAFNKVSKSIRPNESLIDDAVGTSCIEDQMAELDVATDRVQEDYERQLACVSFLRQAKGFTELLQQGMADVRNLFYSKILSDVHEAIEFFVVTKEAGVKAVGPSLVAMLSLIWSSDESIRKAVVDASSKLYFMPPAEERLSECEMYEHTFGNLLALVKDSTIGHLASLERVLGLIAEADVLKPGLLHFIWRGLEHQMPVFWGQVMKPQGNSRRNAHELARNLNCTLILLAMLVKGDKRHLSSHLDLLIDICLGADYVEEGRKMPPINLQMAAYVCKLVRKLIPQEKAALVTTQEQNGNKNKVFFDPKTDCFRLPLAHKLFTWTRQILLATLDKPDKSHWIPFADQV